MDEDDFISRIRKQLNNYRGLTDAYIMNLPDFVRLLSDMLGNRKLDSEDRRDICTALGYFIAPLDLIPEAVYGPEGYVDDIYLCCYVISKLAGKHGYELLDQVWEGEEDLEPACGYVLEKAGAELERKGLREKVREYVGME
jgi:uncharacterized membrane protein YkvA (DUF1232 family)